MVGRLARSARKTSACSKGPIKSGNHALNRGHAAFKPTTLGPRPASMASDPLKESYMARLFLLALHSVSFSAGAIVIRDDVDDSKDRVPAYYFPALADMPGEWSRSNRPW